MKHVYTLALLACLWGAASAQDNLLVTNPAALEAMLGQHQAEDYLPSTLINEPAEIIDGIVAQVSSDSLQSYLETLSSFGNRNTGSDTLSNTFGIGAARRWAFAKMQSFSAAQENRLLVSYFQFDQEICEMSRHRNVLGVLPGIGPNRDEIILIQAHMDSRCEGPCDGDCIAEGADDNGSGSVLVMELARVMSRFAYNRTMVFMLTTGEEQGLFGANAFAEFCEQEEIDIRGVYNNDITGGIICGQTASPPGCPGLNDIDSTNVRIYSSGGSILGTSNSRLFARFVQLQYEENVAPSLSFANTIRIQSSEDRAGRGGDHIPFRQRGFSAIRFTSANEHGNGNPNTENYEDRQHTHDDVLRVDTDGDNVVDSFFVDFNYLARNAVINGTSAVASAAGPATPLDFELSFTSGGVRYAIEDADDVGLYRLGIRAFDSQSNYFDTLVTVTEAVDTLAWLPLGKLYQLSAATIDSNNIESHFSEETFVDLINNTQDRPVEYGITLLQNRPNPFDEATTLGILVNGSVQYQSAFLRVADGNGREIWRKPVQLREGLIEVLYGYQHHRYQPGTYYYSLIVDGQVLDTKSMIYAY
jgi:hypothetical protein